MKNVIRRRTVTTQNQAERFVTGGEVFKVEPAGDLEWLKNSKNAEQQLILEYFKKAGAYLLGYSILCNPPQLEH
jgi:hypothetical protein